MSDIQNDESIDVTEPTGLSNKRVVKERAKKGIDADKDRAATLAGIMGVAPGRRWMWWLLSLCHVGHQPAHIVPTTGTVDVPRSFLSFGEMNIGHQLLAAIHRSCPKEYLKMVEEAHEQEVSNA